MVLRHKNRNSLVDRSLVFTVSPHSGPSFTWLAGSLGSDKQVIESMIAFETGSVPRGLFILG